MLIETPRLLANAAVETIDINVASKKYFIGYFIKFVIKIIKRYKVIVSEGWTDPIRKAQCVMSG